MNVKAYMFVSPSHRDRCPFSYQQICALADNLGTVVVPRAALCPQGWETSIPKQPVLAKGVLWIFPKGKEKKKITANMSGII